MNSDKPVAELIKLSIQWTIIYKRIKDPTCPMRTEWFQNKNFKKNYKYSNDTLCQLLDNRRNGISE